MWAQTELIQLFRRDSDPSLINRGIQIGLTTKTGRGGRSSNEIEDGFIFQPPSPDRSNGKFGGIMGRTHDHIALVMANVIDPIRDGFALSRVQKVVHIDLASLLPPLRSGLLKVADQLPLFGIDTDDRPMAVQISLTPAPDVAKLLVAVGRLLARHSFVIDPQRIILGLQQATNRRQTDGIVYRQSLLDFAQGLVRPFQTREVVSSAINLFKVITGPGLFFQSGGDHRPWP